MKPQLFLDLDGVLGDFFAYYKEQFGVEVTHETMDKELIQNHRGGFFRQLPEMPDAKELWNGVVAMGFSPIVLTAAGPDSFRNGIAQQKEQWVAEHFGGNVPTIVTRAGKKWVYAKPGDILVDDWPEYKDRWEQNAEGVFILHTSAQSSLEQLRKLHV